MGAARIMIICVAFVAPIGLALVVRGMMVGKPVKALPMATAQASVPSVPMVRILVAKRDLGVGTRLGPDDMTWQSVPKDGVNPNFITDGGPAVVKPTTESAKAAAVGAQVVKDAVNGQPASMTSLVGAVVHDQISAGEPILEKKLIRLGEGGYLAAVLTPGMRAVALSLTTENGAGGFILPGDHVDVIQVREQESATPGAKSITVSRVSKLVPCLA